MEKRDGSIKSYGDDYEREDFLFTYNDEEKQRHEINEANAKLVFQPKFIPFYPELLELGLTYLECLLYWFINFYLKAWDKFYFTNEQLWSIFGCSEKTVSNSIIKLEKIWLIKNKYRQKANWWKIRFIQIEENVNLGIDQSTKKWIWNPQKGDDNNNKINNNKIDSSKEESNIHSLKNEICIKNEEFAEIEHPQAPVAKEKLTVIEFYNWDDPYVISMMKNSNFEKNNIEAINKLLKKGYTRETIQTVCNFIKQDDFWSKQIRSLPKLLKKNPDWVMYIDVMIDKIKQRKPRNNFIPSF